MKTRFKKLLVGVLTLAVILTYSVPYIGFADGDKADVDSGFTLTEESFDEELTASLPCDVEITSEEPAVEEQSEAAEPVEKAVEEKAEESDASDAPDESVKEDIQEEDVELDEEEDAVMHDDEGVMLFAVTPENAPMLLGAAPTTSGWKVKATKEWNYPGSSKQPCKKWQAWNTADPDDKITAYCIQPHLFGPVDKVGSTYTYKSGNVTKSVDSDVQKCLYYCYGYPGWDELKPLIDKYMKGTDFSPNKSGYAASSQYYMCCHILISMFACHDTSRTSHAFDGMESGSYANERDAFRDVYHKIEKFDSVPTGEMNIGIRKVGEDGYTSGTFSIKASEFTYNAKATTGTYQGISYDKLAKRVISPKMRIDCNSKDRVKVKIFSGSRLNVCRDLGKDNERILSYDYGADSAYIDDNNCVNLRDGDIFWYQFKETKTGDLSTNLKSQNGTFIPFVAMCSGKQNIAFAATEDVAKLTLKLALPEGALRIYKKDDGSCEFTKDNPAYSLKGAKFEISYGSTIVDTVSADSLSTATSKKGQYFVLKKGLHLGKYTVKEVQAPEGYSLNNTPVTVTVDKNYSATADAAEITIENTPKLDPLVLSIKKVDAETGKAVPQGKASMKGAVYKINYYGIEANQKSDAGKEIQSKYSPDAVWYVETDEDGFATLSEDYLASEYANSDFYYTESDGEKYVAIPHGVITIQEEKAPVGYGANDKILVKNITSANNAKFEYTSEEPVKRGDFSFKKVKKFSDEPMANVLFRVTNTETGECHYVVTDENGEFSSQINKNTNKTNANDEAVSDSGIEESKLDPMAGIWFGELSACSDDKGALLPGHYKIQEMSTTANRAKILALPTEFDVEEDGYTVFTGKIENHGMEIKTHAVDSITETQDGFAKDDEVIIDSLEYKYAVEGTEYTVTTTVKNAETGEAIMNDGKPATATTKFTAKDTEGTVECPITVDTKGMDKAKIVVFESVSFTDEDGTHEIAFEEDLKDADQTVTLTVPEIGTTAVDSDTEDHIALADDEITLVDTVAYEKLIPGKEYTVSGKLMDKSTGKALLVDGKEVTSSAKFTPEVADGTVDIEFKFDGSKLAGKSVVAFETVSYKDLEVAVHADINDEGQTVNVPDVHTTALDSETGEHMAMADDEVTVIDTVKYENLLPGKEYKVSGKLMDKSTGEPLLVEGEEVTAEKTFKAEAADGSVDLEFTFNGSALRSQAIVVFEDIYYGDKKIGTHADITDEDQTVEFPDIKTTAVDSDTEDHIAMADSEITIIDTVEYKNLVTGKEYTVRGTLMDKATGNPVLVGGEKVTAESTFTPEAKDGTVDVTFVFDGTGLEGTKTVVFEDLYYGDKEVAVHADIDDEGQEVDIPDVHTTAVDTESEDHIALADENVIIIDTVKYENLLPNKEYKVSGELYDKETGEPIGVTAEKTFKAEAAEGTVDIEFKFDGSKLAGKTVVAFEDIYYNDKKVGTHADITDEDQSVDFPDVHTTAVDSETEDHVTMADSEITIIDTVAYENLLPGKEYKVSGVLMDKKTGKAVIVDGEKVTAESTFTAERADGTVDVTFTFDGTGLAGTKTVVFETIYYNDVEVGVHADIEDEGQEVDFPDVHTTALDSDTRDHAAMADDKVTVIDTVKYENLLPGKEYKVTGELYDKETGESIGVTAEKTFTAEAADGSVDIEFTFDGSKLAGKTVVAFEDIFFKDIKVGTHADITDEDQSVHIPEIGTTASANRDSTEITDTVEYKNLVPGKKYTVTGVLMDKKTGKAVKSDGKAVTGEAVFTPMKESGTTEVKFKFHIGDVAGKTTVVFEEMFIGKAEDVNKVAEHKDIEDVAQTVIFDDEGYAEVDDEGILDGWGHTPKTGFPVMLAVLMAIMLLSLVALIVLINKRRKME